MMNNVQWSMSNEWTNGQWANGLTHFSIEHSLPIVHCPLSISDYVRLEA